MNKVFAVEICNKNQEAELQLPATDYQLLDLVEKLGIIEDVKPSVSTPNYTILLELEREGMSTKLPLPTQVVEIDRVLRSINSFGWSDPLLRVTCLDCAAPSLIPILGGRDDPDDLNLLALLISQMNPKQLTKYKATLDAVEDWSLSGAIRTVHNLDDYLFSPHLTGPEAVALDFLSSSVGESSMETLLRYVNVYG